MISNIALSGAMAAQAALAVSSQNTANAMTEGYTRQGVQLSAVGALGRKNSPGNGVEVSALLRFADSYKSQQLWKSQSGLAQYSLPQQYYTQLESVLGDDTANIDHGLDTFFAALNASTTEPTSTPLRQQVLTAAEAVAQRFNQAAQLIDNQRVSIARQRGAMVDEANSLLGSIAQLNEKIVASQTTAGSGVSGLIDERDNKIDELAKILGVQVLDKADGSRDVTLPGGQPLVLGSLAGQLSLQTLADGTQSTTVKFVNDTFTLPATGLGGGLGGLGDFESRELLPLRQSLAEMARQFGDAFNTQLTAGFAQDGTAGKPLFDTAPGSGLLQVRTDVKAQDLAFSSDSTQPGDSGNLLRLVAQQNQSVSLTSTGSVLLSDAHTQLLGRLAMNSRQNQVAITTATTVRNQAVESWKSTSGVNLDEEAINLLQYRQMYEANMKVVGVANDLMDMTLALIR
ncbi:flagellar hook-associated protein FlgK [Acidovorax sp. NCPPB 2350]|nr:flagellar hook-associated protein FlgK [Acidovorax sp. NCPPB 2350]